MDPQHTINLENISYNLANRQYKIYTKDEPIVCSGFFFHKKPKVPDATSYIDKVFSTKYYANVEGVFIRSETREGFNKLYNFLLYVKEHVNNVNANYFFEYIVKHGITITDTKMKDSNGSFQFGRVIYLSEETLNNNNIGTFFHEAGHVVDNMSNNYRNGKKHFDNALQKCTYINIQEFRRDYELISKNIENRILNGSELYMKADAEFNKLYPNVTGKKKVRLLAEIKNSLFHQLKDHYMRESGYAALSDIIDALYKGRIHDSEKKYGHGIEYYKRDGAMATEVFANFSDLYNLEKTHLLDNYFPREFREELTSGYEELIEIKKLKMNLNNCKTIHETKYGDGTFITALLAYLNNKNLNCFSEEIKNYMNSLSENQIKKYLTSSDVIHEVLNRALNAQDNKYGSGTFYESLKEYVNSGNIKVITRDYFARDIVRLLTKDQIILYLCNYEAKDLNKTTQK